jgi:hypothetical protein
MVTARGLAHRTDRGRPRGRLPKWLRLSQAAGAAAALAFMPSVSAAGASSSPGAPGSVAGSGVVCGMAVTWTAPSSSGGSPIASYTVEPLQYGTATPNAWPVTVKGGVTAARVPAYPGTYTVAVYATNQAGVTGPPGYSGSIKVVGNCPW